MPDIAMAVIVLCSVIVGYCLRDLKEKPVSRVMHQAHFNEDMEAETPEE